jgi:hypothetical protein
MSLNISSSSSTGGSSSIPTASEMQGFSDTLKGASSKDLLGALGKQGMEPWQKDAILKELENRAEKSQQSDQSGGANGAGDSGSGSGGDDDIKKLLKKLTKGTISPEEEQKLAGALGVDTQTLDAAKGGGSSDSGSSSGGSEIQGG